MIQTAFGWILLSFAVYGLVHSWTASIGFKAGVERRWPKFHRKFYRLFYNLFSAATFVPIMLGVVFLPDAEIYRLTPPWNLILRAVQFTAILLFIVSLFQTDVWSFAGLRQEAKPTPGAAASSVLVTGGLYRLVRHPLYFFGIVFMWCSPSLTWNGLGFNLGATLYILVGMVFEERKLLREFGAEYARYRSEVPGLIPFIKFRRR